MTRLDTQSGEPRLIAVKGLPASEGPITVTPNEHRVAGDRPDCYWLCVVTDRAGEQPELNAHKDPARFGWREVTEAHYALPVAVLNRQAESANSSEPTGGNGS